MTGRINTLLRWFAGFGPDEHWRVSVISQKAKYAIKALLVLARASGEGCRAIPPLSHRHRISLKNPLSYTFRTAQTRLRIQRQGAGRRLQAFETTRRHIRSKRVACHGWTDCRPALCQPEFLTAAATIASTKTAARFAKSWWTYAKAVVNNSGQHISCTGGRFETFECRRQEISGKSPLAANALLGTPPRFGRFRERYVSENFIRGTIQPGQDLSDCADAGCGALRTDIVRPAPA